MASTYRNAEDLQLYISSDGLHDDAIDVHADDDAASATSDVLLETFPVEKSDGR